jgi:hypothetical protein
LFSLRYLLEIDNQLVVNSIFIKNLPKFKKDIQLKAGLLAPAFKFVIIKK